MHSFQLVSKGNDSLLLTIVFFRQGGSGLGVVVLQLNPQCLLLCQLFLEVRKESSLLVQGLTKSAALVPPNLLLVMEDITGNLANACFGREFVLVLLVAFSVPPVVLLVVPMVVLVVLLVLLVVPLVPLVSVVPMVPVVSRPVLITLCLQVVNVSSCRIGNSLALLVLVKDNPLRSRSRKEVVVVEVEDVSARCGIDVN